MAEPEQKTAILARALAYPYATPDRSYLYRDGRALELPAGGPDLDGRSPLLSYGANSAPESLARKLAPLPGVEMPVRVAELEGWDVAYSAHVSPYGAIPATLIESPGTTAPVFVIYPTPEQRALLTASEPNYDLGEVDGIAAYRSKHGPLSIDGNAVALAAVRSTVRTLPELDEPAVLERVRAQLAPDLTLEQFVHLCVERGGIKPLPELHQILYPAGG
ncbi:MAG TPA: hypothetical protein VFJ65_00750 [Solirubrobacterales bacterium]|nr:hypothetical protein [Solirubrobacterales bacterium]